MPRKTAELCSIRHGKHYLMSDLYVCCKPSWFLAIGICAVVDSRDSWALNTELTSSVGNTLTCAIAIISPHAHTHNQT